MVPVQEVQMVPVEQVEMVPVQQIGMAPAEQIGMAPIEQIGMAPIEQIGMAPIEQVAPMNQVIPIGQAAEAVSQVAEVRTIHTTEVIPPGQLGTELISSTSEFIPQSQVLPSQVIPNIDQGFLP